MAAEKVSCPGCGGINDIANPGIAQFTCSYCNSVIIKDKDGLKDSGKKSMLMPSLAGLSVGKMGSLRKKPFTVIGRVRYSWSKGSESGSWDEWYLSLGEEEIWLSEDMGKFRLESRKENPGLKGKLKTGSDVTVEGKQYKILETGKAVCSGASGQLPFKVIPDEEYLYANGSSTDGFTLSIEFDGTEPTVFVGTELNASDLNYEKEFKEKRASVERCPSCGASLEISGDAGLVKTVTCNYCFSIFDKNNDDLTEGGKVDQSLAGVFTLPLGAKGKLGEIEWHVAGRMRYDWEDSWENDYGKTETETGHEVEYLLFNENKGYKWLHEAKGHFSFGAPVENPGMEKSLFACTFPKEFVFNADKTESYQFFEKGELKLTYVDGALPWQAHIGTEIRYADAIRPPFVLTEEKSGAGDDSEIEYFRSEYIPVEDVKKAFGINLPASFGVAPGQPFEDKNVTKKKLLKNLILAGFLLVFVGNCYSCFQGDRIIQVQLNPDQIQKKEYASETFHLDAGDSIEVVLNTPVSNSWTYAGIALYDEDQGAVIASQDEELAYYFGGSGEDSWSEGDNKITTMWKVPESGNFKLLVSNLEQEKAFDSSFSLDVTKNSLSNGWLYFLFFLWTVLLVFSRVALKDERASFESQRWAGPLEDYADRLEDSSDDDDDD